MSRYTDAPIRGQTLALDASEAFVQVNGLATHLKELSGATDDLEVSVNRLAFHCAGDDEGDMRADRCREDLKTLREARMQLGWVVDTMLELVIGDAYDTDERFDDEPAAEGRRSSEQPR